MKGLKRKQGGSMDVDIIFKIAAIGILTAVVSQILKNSGKEDISTLATLAGVVIVLFMVLSMIGDLFSNIRTMFNFTLLPML